MLRWHVDAAATLVPAGLQLALQRLGAETSEDEASVVASWGTVLLVGLAVAMADIVLQVEVCSWQSETRT